VRAVASPFNSAFTAPAFTTTPTAVVGVYLTVLSDTEITVNWGEYSPDETGFEIKRSDDGGSTYSVVHTTAPDAITWADSGLTGNTEYFYTVRALDSHGSPESDPVSAATALGGPLYVEFAETWRGRNCGRRITVLSAHRAGMRRRSNTTTGSLVVYLSGRSGLYAGAPPVT
jgi:hypothetical protein